jgi:hypothetical protein
MTVGRSNPATRHSLLLFFVLAYALPTRLASAAIGAMRLFNRHATDLFDFFATACRFENVAPQFGTHTLDEYFQELSRPPAER